MMDIFLQCSTNKQTVEIKSTENKVKFDPVTEQITEMLLLRSSECRRLHGWIINISVLFLFSGPTRQTPSEQNRIVGVIVAVMFINEVHGGTRRMDVDGAAISCCWWYNHNHEDKTTFWSQESDVSELSSCQSEDRLVLRWRWTYNRYEQVVSVVMDEVDIHLSSEPLMRILMTRSRPAWLYSRIHLLRHQTAISWMTPAVPGGAEDPQLWLLLLIVSLTFKLHLESKTPSRLQYSC